LNRYSGTYRSAIILLSVFLVGLATVDNGVADAERRAMEVIEEEDDFKVIRLNGMETELIGDGSSYLESNTIRTIMKEAGATMVVEGALARSESDITNIELRISARTSTWRPPTILTTTASGPDFAVSRTEALVRRFMNSYSDEQSMERFFQSALLPGLGQYQEGRKTRAGLFFLGTTGCLFGSLLLSDGDQYVGDGIVEMKNFPGNVTRWYIDGTIVSPEEAAEELQRRTEAENSRDKAQKKKRYLIGAGLALYAVNLYDILKITKRYDSTEGDYFSFKVNPFSPKKIVCVNCGFNVRYF